MIKLEAVGRLGKDAIQKEVKDGKTYVAFTMAVTPFPGSDETLWIDVMYRTDRLGVVDYLKKGRQVFVSGRFSVGVDSFNDQHQAKVTLWAKDLELLGSMPS